jgi:hypothetical protein
MVRFFRILILTVIVLVILAYAALWAMADEVVDIIYKPITSEFIGAFGPSADDEYKYDVSVRLWPPTAVISGLFIEAQALNINTETWHGAHLGIDKVELELIPLIRDNRIEVKEISGRRFVGLLTNPELALYLERHSPDLRDLRISEYQGKCRINGKFGVTSIMPITLLGDWFINDEGVVSFRNTEYYNPDSVIPEGFVQLVQERNSFDVAMEILGGRLVIDQVVYDNNGLWISAAEQQ